MGIRRICAQGLATLALAMLAAPAAQAAPAAIDLFYQRALMSAANAACRLFAPDVATALTASELQARGAALRSGADPAALAQVQAKAAADVQADGCGSSSIAAAAAQVRSGFDGYAHLQQMPFPGDGGVWTAERAPTDGVAHWRVTQSQRFGWDSLRFGVVGNGGARFLMAAASFADGAQPYGARLVLRDVTATSGPFLDVRLADADGRIPLDGRLPPRMSTVSFNAEAMSPAGKDLASGMAPAFVFRFPAASLAAMQSLDPRESVAVEFLFAGDNDDEVRTAYVDVGDFAAADAFQAIAQR
ncbi:MAG TPA: hypothetical protein VGL58_15850 [Caulobacteraceae bacterium]|jgi:hypothetical protein